MANRISSSRSRSSSSGFRATSRMSMPRTSSRSTFRPSTTRSFGGYRYRTNPYQRNYFFHSLGTVGKTIYLVCSGIFILIMVLLAIFY